MNLEIRVKRMPATTVRVYVCMCKGSGPLSRLHGPLRDIFIAPRAIFIPSARDPSSQRTELILFSRPLAVGLTFSTCFFRPTFPPT